MNTYKLTQMLSRQVQRYRIASVKLLVNELPREQYSHAMRILKTNQNFQVFDDTAGTACVCQRRKRTPSSTSVARCIATHEFCRAGTAKRKLLTKLDVKKFFPMLFRHGLPAGYYVDATGSNPLLGVVRVDVHTLPVNRIWQRSFKLLEHHRRQREFRKLILGQHFQITWLVPSPSKVNAIHHLANRQQRDIPVVAQSVPSLLNQLAPLPNTFPDVVGL